MNWKQILGGVIIGAIIGGCGTFFAFQGRISKLEAMAQLREQVQNVSPPQVQQPGLPIGSYSSVPNHLQSQPVIHVDNSNNNQQTVTIPDTKLQTQYAQLESELDKSLAENQKLRLDLAAANDRSRARAKLLEKAKEFVYASLKQEIDGELR